MDTEWKKLVKEAQRQGWRVQIGGKGQLKLIPPHPSDEIVSSTELRRITEPFETRWRI